MVSCLAQPGSPPLGRRWWGQSDPPEQALGSGAGRVSLPQKVGIGCTELDPTRVLGMQTVPPWSTSASLGPLIWHLPPLFNSCWDTFQTTPFLAPPPQSSILGIYKMGSSVCGGGGHTQPSIMGYVDRNFADLSYMALILVIQTFREMILTSWEWYKHCRCPCCSENLDSRLLGDSTVYLSFTWTYFLGREWSFSFRGPHLHRSLPSLWQHISHGHILFVKF